jgi:hypothetical protein
MLSHGSSELVFINESTSISVDVWPDLINGSFDIVMILFWNISRDAVEDFLLGKHGISILVAVVNDVGSGWSPSCKELGKLWSFTLWFLASFLLSKSSMLSHGSGELMFINESTSISVNVWPDFINGCLDIGMILFWNIFLDAVEDFLLGKHGISVFVAMVNDIGSGWSPSCKKLGELWSFTLWFLTSLLLSKSSFAPHGSSKLVFVNESTSISVNVWPDIINEVLSFLVMLFWNVFLDAVEDFLLGKHGISILVAVVNNVGSGWSLCCKKLGEFGLWSSSLKVDSEGSADKNGGEFHRSVDLFWVNLLSRFEINPLLKPDFSQN